MPKVLSTATITLLLLILAWVDSSPATGAPLDAPTIKAGLRTATPEEGNFVERVVEMTSSGQLPQQLLESTFLWARKKPQHRFQYFKRAMIVRAEKLGISL